MTPIALGLVFIAGIFHVFWNYLAKASENKTVFLWIINTVFIVTYLPIFFVLGNPFVLSIKGWVVVLVSGLSHAIYFWSLGKAYEVGDLSLVYPLARGSSVFLVPLLSIPLLAEQLSLMGGVAIGLILVGIFILHMKPGPWKNLGSFTNTSGSMWALLTGGAITLFSLVDKVGVGIVDPILYTYLVFLATALFFTPMVLIKGVSPIQKTWRAQPIRLVILGLLMPVAYALVLYAYKLAPVAYVVASREIRLVFGTIIGTFALKEGHAPLRISGSTLIVLGVLLLAFAK
jgi:uncharacterized membrane protein